MRVWETRKLRGMDTGSDGPAHEVSERNKLPFMLQSAKESGFFLPCPENLGEAECKVRDEFVWWEKSQNRCHGYSCRSIVSKRTTAEEKDNKNV